MPEQEHNEGKKKLI